MQHSIATFPREFRDLEATSQLPPSTLQQCVTPSTVLLPATVAAMSPQLTTPSLVAAVGSPLVLSGHPLLSQLHHAISLAPQENLNAVASGSFNIPAADVATHVGLGVGASGGGCVVCSGGNTTNWSPPQFAQAPPPLRLSGSSSSGRLPPPRAGAGAGPAHETGDSAADGHNNGVGGLGGLISTGRVDDSALMPLTPTSSAATTTPQSRSTPESARTPPQQQHKPSQHQRLPFTPMPQYGSTGGGALAPAHAVAAMAGDVRLRSAALLVDAPSVGATVVDGPEAAGSGAGGGNQSRSSSSWYAGRAELRVDSGRRHVVTNSPHPHHAVPFPLHQMWDANAAYVLTPLSTSSEPSTPATLSGTSRVPSQTQFYAPHSLAAATAPDGGVCALFPLTSVMKATAEPAPAPAPQGAQRGRVVSGRRGSAADPRRDPQQHVAEPPRRSTPATPLAPTTAAHMQLALRESAMMIATPLAPSAYVTVGTPPTSSSPLLGGPLPPRAVMAAAAASVNVSPRAANAVDTPSPPSSLGRGRRASAGSGGAPATAAVLATRRALTPPLSSSSASVVTTSASPPPPLPYMRLSHAIRTEGSCRGTSPASTSASHAAAHVTHGLQQQQQQQSPPHHNNIGGISTMSGTLAFVPIGVQPAATTAGSPSFFHTAPGAPAHRGSSPVSGCFAATSLTSMHVPAMVGLEAPTPADGGLRSRAGTPPVSSSQPYWTFPRAPVGSVTAILTAPEVSWHARSSSPNGSGGAAVLADVHGRHPVMVNSAGVASTGITGSTTAASCADSGSTGASPSCSVATPRALSPAAQRPAASTASSTAPEVLSSAAGSAAGRGSGAWMATAPASYRSALLYGGSGAHGAGGGGGDGGGGGGGASGTPSASVAAAVSGAAHTFPGYPSQPQLLCTPVPLEDTESVCVICFEGRAVEGPSAAAATAMPTTATQETAQPRAEESRRPERANAVASPAASDEGGGSCGSLRGVKRGSCLLSLPCGHCCHQNCVQRWLMESLSCPMCRRDLTQDATMH